MIVVDSISRAVSYLMHGYQVAKVTMDYPGMGKEDLVTGILMGLSKEVWWYVLLCEKDGKVCGFVPKSTFVSLYEMYYIEPAAQRSETEIYYSINTVCAIQEMPRYLRRIESWEEAISSPKGTTKALFG